MEKTRPCRREGYTLNKALASIPADLKEENRRAVLLAFHDSGRLSAVDVAEKTGISRQTVKKCIGYYEEQGILCSCGKGSSSSLGGKRPELFSLNETIRLVSILIHHNGIVLNLTDVHYNLLGHWDSGPLRAESMDHMFDIIQRGAETFDRRELDMVRSVCIVAPIGLNEQGGVRVATPFPHWPTSDFGRSLTEPLWETFPSAKHVQAIGDGNAAGFALLYQRPELRSRARVLSLYSAEGIGGAIFRDGELDAGANRLCGTFGHMVVDPNDPEPCPCGGRGCLERLVCPKRMRERLLRQEEAYAESWLAGTPVEEVTFRQLFEGSRRGDALCRRESVYFADIFSLALHNIIVLMDPSHIIFQGDFGLADDTFRQQLVNQLSDFRYIGNIHSIQIDYDPKDLSMQETIGATYCMIMDYLKNPEQYRAD